jgi:hypothetical protein
MRIQIGKKEWDLETCRKSYKRVFTARVGSFFAKFPD